MRDSRPLPKQLGISLANVNRLGCASPSYGFGGMPIFNLMTLTQLGLALYRACGSRSVQNGDQMIGQPPDHVSATVAASGR
jgi:hypothetical protein